MSPCQDLGVRKQTNPNEIGKSFPGTIKAGPHLRMLGKKHKHARARAPFHFLFGHSFQCHPVYRSISTISPTNKDTFDCPRRDRTKVTNPGAGASTLQADVQFYPAPASHPCLSVPCEQPIPEAQRCRPKHLLGNQ